MGSWRERQRATREGGLAKRGNEAVNGRRARSASRRLRRDGQPPREMPVSQAERCAAKEDVARMLSVDERNGERDRRTAHAKARVSEQASLTRARGEGTHASRRCLHRALPEVRHARTSRASRAALHLMRYDALCAADAPACARPILRRSLRHLPLLSCAAASLLPCTEAPSQRRRAHTRLIGSCTASSAFLACRPRCRRAVPGCCAHSCQP